MNEHKIFFDIETGSLPIFELEAMLPAFDPPSNYKDADKIAANIEEQKRKWIDRAALSPLTGRVICIGIINQLGEFSIMGEDGDEVALLNQWRNFVAENKDEMFIGFNIFNFDMPFLTKRAWHRGITPCVRPGYNFYRQEHFVDARQVWQCGDRTAEGSLDAIAKFFGLGGKGGSGKDFAALWENDREAARAYLKKDLELTRDVSLRMGI